MLDFFAIFGRGGALLWSHRFTALRHDPTEALNSLIRDCLLEERSGETTFTYTPKAGAQQAMKWTFHNGMGLVFVAMYQKTLSLMYVDELLQQVKATFCSDAWFKPDGYDYKGFDATFNKLLRECEGRADDAKRSVAMKAPSAPPPKPATSSGTRAAASGGKGAVAAAAARRGGAEESGDDSAVAGGSEDGAVSDAAPSSKQAPTDTDGGMTSDAAGATDSERENNAAAASAPLSSSPNAGGFDLSKLSKLAGKGGARGGAKASGPLASSSRSAANSVDSKSKKASEKDGGNSGKKARNWGTYGRGDGTPPSKLDYSELADGGSGGGGSAAEQAAAAAALAVGRSRMDQDDDDDAAAAAFDDDLDLGELGDVSDSDGGSVSSATTGVSGASSSAAAAAAVAARRSGLLYSFMASLTTRVVGKSSLSAEDLAPALAEMKRKLMERNVAEGIAQQVCDSVASGLEGRALASFTGIGAFVRKAFEDSLSGILNKRSVDVLLDIKQCRARGRPYVMVFCGVNGVGKSTNLAKIAYWLLQHGVRVLIAACDTFRAGAVEQLKTHCARLKVPLYERGYEKDPAKVASEAIRQAERDGIDAVLVDTAGRMQDNEPLMRALSSLINVNAPNLVLFVGEALVGNDAVDQLVKFNRALYDLAPVTATVKRQIDGIVLTKFDTIDDKVGAALSMVYSSGAPIMFVGCGQTYVDLKKLNVKGVVNSLLK